MPKQSATPKTGPPRGIKAMLKRTAMGKLVKARGYTCYRRIGANNRPTGPKLGGVAKRLRTLASALEDLGAIAPRFVIRRPFVRRRPGVRCGGVPVG